MSSKQPAQTATDANQLLTVDGLAAVLQVPVSWVYKRTSRREIPFVKLGGHLRFTPDDVAAILAAGRQIPVERRRAV